MWISHLRAHQLVDAFHRLDDYPRAHAQSYISKDFSRVAQNAIGKFCGITSRVRLSVIVLFLSLISACGLILVILGRCRGGVKRIQPIRGCKNIHRLLHSVLIGFSVLATPALGRLRARPPPYPVRFRRITLSPPPCIGIVLFEHLIVAFPSP